MTQHFVVMPANNVVELSSDLSLGRIVSDGVRECAHLVRNGTLRNRSISMARVADVLESVAVSPSCIHNTTHHFAGFGEDRHRTLPSVYGRDT